MNLEEAPGLSDAERAAVSAYEQAHMDYAASAMGALFDSLRGDDHGDADLATRALPLRKDSASLAYIVPLRCSLYSRRLCAAVPFASSETC